MHDSDYVTTCTSKIPYIWLQYDLHSSYNQTKYIGEEESINYILSTYVEPLLNLINHPALVQE